MRLQRTIHTERRESSRTCVSELEREQTEQIGHCLQQTSPRANIRASYKNRGMVHAVSPVLLQQFLTVSSSQITIYLDLGAHVYSVLSWIQTELDRRIRSIGGFTFYRAKVDM
ncbi:hypothetical protein RRG08_026872 [Elysia crispata]|uniref:Uncharacterized protein n=1 Tax=Elysia crispata TaxID=231223 RepID=A0AAE1CT42_9GAST|nr:hypothetical protein RRG08_026872 [Elysia crispata]